MPRLRLDIEAAPSYEFALSLAAAAEGGGWQTGIGLAERVAGFAPSEMVWAHLLTVAYDTPPPRDVDSLIKAVRHMHPSELRLRLLGYYVRYFRRATPPEVIAAAARGDRTSARIFLETSYPGDERWQAALRKLLPLDAWQTRRELLDVLVGWRDVFAQNYDPAPLAAEVAARRRHAGSLKAERVIAAVMDGWEYVAEPGITSVLLVPSRVTWPHWHVFDHHSTKLLCYPLPGETAPLQTEPPARLVAVAQAVADPRRLKILKELAAGDQPAQELSLRLGIGLTTLVHHLAVLTRSGLLTTGGGRRKRYRLRPEAAAELGAGLARYLRS